MVTNSLIVWRGIAKLYNVETELVATTIKKLIAFIAGRLVCLRPLGASLCLHPDLLYQRCICKGHAGRQTTAAYIDMQGGRQTSLPIYRELYRRTRVVKAVGVQLLSKVRDGRLRTIQRHGIRVKAFHS